MLWGVVHACVGVTCRVPPEQSARPCLRLLRHGAAGRLSVCWDAGGLGCSATLRAWTTRARMALWQLSSATCSGHPGLAQEIEC